MHVTHENELTVMNWIVTGELTPQGPIQSRPSRDKTLRQGYDEER